MPETLEIPNVASLLEGVRREQRRAGMRAAADLRRDRAKQVRELRALEWRWDMHPTRTLATIIRAKRMLISDLEEQITDAMSAHA